MIGVTAPGAARVGLETTGNPIFVVPGSLLGAPGVSLPVLDDGGLPLGLQVLGFPQGDVTVFAVAAWIAWDRFAKSKIRRPQQRSTRQCIGWIRGLQTPVAQRKGVGDVQLMPSRRVIARGQRPMAQQVWPAQLGQIGCGWPSGS